MDMNEFFRGLLEKYLIQIVFIISVACYRRFRIFIEQLHPFARPVALACLFLIYLLSNYAIYPDKTSYSFWFFIISFIVLVYVVLMELLSFWHLGFLGADRSIAKGIDYGKALKICEDSLDFLGIGANKMIIRDKEFKEAIAKCQRDEKPVRLLLCPPDHEELISIARRAGKPQNEYQETVKKSLRALQILKHSESRNIEVRFYNELPLFRLMFINDNICLASHYILGEGDGSQLPQLHVWKKPLGRRDIESFYYPLKKYFDKLWESAEIWDFSKHL